MGNFGYLQKKIDAQNLRKSGKSYKEIIALLHIPKSTVSDWCKDITLTKQQQEKLYKCKKVGALKGSFIASQNKRNRRIILTKKLFEEGRSLVVNVSNESSFVAGLAFYASEGTKIDKGCCFSNSDPNIIRFMIRWFRICWKVPNNKFHGSIWLHEGLSESSAIKYWSQLTKIPKTQFYKTYIAKDKSKSRKIRKNKHQFGVFSFYIHDISLLRKIMGGIDGILNQA